MKSKAPKLKTWTVYRQNPPVFVGKDKTGENVYRPDLEIVGSVEAMNTDEAFEFANVICKAPVLEEVTNVQ